MNSAVVASGSLVSPYTSSASATSPTASPIEFVV